MESVHFAEPSGPARNPCDSAGITTDLESGPGEDRALAEGERMVIFVRTFDFLAWLLPMTNHFPRAQRLSVTQRLLDAALDLRERLEEANRRRGGARRERLDRADECLAKVRMYLRLAFHLKWMTREQSRVDGRAREPDGPAWTDGAVTGGGDELVVESAHQ